MYAPLAQQPAFVASPQGPAYWHQPASYAQPGVVAPVMAGGFVQPAPVMMMAPMAPAMVYLAPVPAYPQPVAMAHYPVPQAPHPAIWYPQPAPAQAAPLIAHEGAAPARPQAVAPAAQAPAGAPPAQAEAATEGDAETLSAIDEVRAQLRAFAGSLDALRATRSA